MFALMGIFCFPTRLRKHIGRELWHATQTRTQTTQKQVSHINDFICLRLFTLSGFGATDLPLFWTMCFNRLTVQRLKEQALIDFNAARQRCHIANRGLFPAVGFSVRHSHHHHRTSVSTVCPPWVLELPCSLLPGSTSTIRPGNFCVVFCRQGSRKAPCTKDW